MVNLEVETAEAISGLYRVKANGAGGASYAEIYASSGRRQRGHATYAFDPGTGLLTISGQIKEVMTDDGRSFVALDMGEPGGSAVLCIGLKTSR